MIRSALPISLPRSLSRRLCWRVVAITAVLFALSASIASARTKLVALPERGEVVLRMEQADELPGATLVSEERLLTIQPGLNRIDFSWNGVSIDPDSIRLALLAHQEQARLLSVSFPPNEQALIWEIYADEALTLPTRISYLLEGIDRLTEYRLLVDSDEQQADLHAFLVLRNFSGEDFGRAAVELPYAPRAEIVSRHGETRRTLLLRARDLPLRKVWRFDSAQQPWDPESVDGNVGIPVSYELENRNASGLGEHTLDRGKVRVFLDDGHGGNIFAGEDRSEIVPVGEPMEVAIGSSRDLVVTLRKMKEERTNVRRNRRGRIVLHDLEQTFVAKIENFKPQPARLTLDHHIGGEWEMRHCSHPYKRKDVDTLEFDIDLAPNHQEELIMELTLRNLRS